MQKWWLLLVYINIKLLKKKKKKGLEYRDEDWIVVGPIFEGEGGE